MKKWLIVLLAMVMAIATFGLVACDEVNNNNGNNNGSGGNGGEQDSGEIVYEVSSDEWVSAFRLDTITNFTAEMKENGSSENAVEGDGVYTFSRDGNKFFMGGEGGQTYYEFTASKTYAYYLDVTENKFIKLSTDKSIIEISGLVFEFIMPLNSEYNHATFDSQTNTYTVVMTDLVFEEETIDTATYQVVFKNGKISSVALEMLAEGGKLTCNFNVGGAVVELPKNVIDQTDSVEPDYNPDQGYNPDEKPGYTPDDKPTENPGQGSGVESNVNSEMWASATDLSKFENYHYAYSTNTFSQTIIRDGNKIMYNVNSPYSSLTKLAIFGNGQVFEYNNNSSTGEYSPVATLEDYQSTYKKYMVDGLIYLDWIKEESSNFSRFDEKQFNFVYIGSNEQLRPIVDNGERCYFSVKSCNIILNEELTAVDSIILEIKCYANDDINSNPMYTANIRFDANMGEVNLNELGISDPTNPNTVDDSIWGEQLDVSKFTDYTMTSAFSEADRNVLLTYVQSGENKRVYRVADGATTFADIIKYQDGSDFTYGERKLTGTALEYEYTIVSDKDAISKIDEEFNNYHTSVHSVVYALSGQFGNAYYNDQEGVYELSISSDIGVNDGRITNPYYVIKFENGKLVSIKLTGTFINADGQDMPLEVNIDNSAQIDTPEFKEEYNAHKVDKEVWEAKVEQTNINNFTGKESNKLPDGSISSNVYSLANGNEVYNMSIEFPSNPSNNMSIGYVKYYAIEETLYGKKDGAGTNYVKITNSAEIDGLNQNLSACKNSYLSLIGAVKEYYEQAEFNQETNAYELTIENFNDDTIRTAYYVIKFVEGELVSIKIEGIKVLEQGETSDVDFTMTLEFGNAVIDEPTIEDPVPEEQDVYTVKDETEWKAAFDFINLDFMYTQNFEMMGSESYVKKDGEKVERTTQGLQHLVLNENEAALYENGEKHEYTYENILIIFNSELVPLSWILDNFSSFEYNETTKAYEYVNVDPEPFRTMMVGEDGITPTVYMQISSCSVKIVNGVISEIQLQAEGFMDNTGSNSVGNIILNLTVGDQTVDLPTV